ESDVQTETYVGSIDSDTDRLVLTVTSCACAAMYAPSARHYQFWQRPAPSGYLVWKTDAFTLMAQPFDPGSLQLTGEAVPVKGVTQSRDLDLTFAANGTMAWSTGSTGKYQMLWYDRTGKVVGSVGPPGDFGDMAISPDDKQVAYHNRSGLDDVWLYEFA